MKYRGHAKRADANQKEIVMSLRKIGCEVEQLTGRAGMPDLLVSLGKKIFLIEVKNKEGENKVNDDQVKFHNRFPVTVVRTIDEAMEAVTARNGSN